MERKHLSVADNLEELLAVLPEEIRTQLMGMENLCTLLEVVLDLGRKPEARFQEDFVFLRESPVTQEDINFVAARVGEFGDDNRGGIERTLHRISAIRNRRGRIVGLTCRVGRAVFGTIDIIRDIVESGQSILLLGRPGVGKTTKLRETARVLSDEFRKRVVIVDTSNEIAGDGDIPHPGIGYARRMQVSTPDRQHDVMIEAVENHMPEVVVIDEIGRTAEAYAARTIAERGVQLIATAHGTTLENLLMNPTLSDLVGGIQAVTLSDEEARRRSTQKTVLERKAPPTFDVVIEIIERDKLALHHDVGGVVDAILRGKPIQPEVRQRREDGGVEVIQESIRSQVPEGYKLADNGPSNGRIKSLYPYGISRNRLEKAVKSLGLTLELTKTWQEADGVLTLKAHYRKDSPKLRDAMDRNVPIYVVRSNTYSQIAGRLRQIFALPEAEPEETGLREAEVAVKLVLETNKPADLLPQNSGVRRQQHELAGRHHLRTYSIGKEPNRRVRIIPS